MLLIPAIDLKDGQCVRLRQGRMDDSTVFSTDAVATAGRWVDAGCRRLHVVDLNGAFAGQPVNAAAVRRIVDAFPDLPIQVGGGIRSQPVAEAYLEAGVRWVIVGTQAVREPQFVAKLCERFPGRVIVGLDARDGRVAVDGWATLTSHRVGDLAGQFADIGVHSIVYTDIGRDGMMDGVNVEATAKLARDINIPVIASGGVSTLDDVRALTMISSLGVVGAIVGRALYEGSLDLAVAQRCADGMDS